MSIENSYLIDGIAINRADNNCQLVMLISDHLDWSNEYNHLHLLQEKINSYLAYCETSQYVKYYPDTQFDCALIEIHFAFEPTRNAIRFLSNVRVELAPLGVEVECHVDFD